MRTRKVRLSQTLAADSFSLVLIVAVCLHHLCFSVSILSMSYTFSLSQYDFAPVHPQSEVHTIIRSSQMYLCFRKLYVQRALDRQLREAWALWKWGLIPCYHIYLHRIAHVHETICVSRNFKNQVDDALGCRYGYCFIHGRGDTLTIMILFSHV